MFVPSRQPKQKRSRRKFDKDPEKGPLHRFDYWLGLDHPDHFDRLVRFLIGVVVPLGFIGYGIKGFIAGETVFFGKGRAIELTGWEAFWCSLGYLSFGLYIHVHYVWTNHTWLANIAYGVLYLLGVLIGVSVLGLFVSILAF